jgi:hypothetical protein
MASPGGLAEQSRDMIPRRVRGTTWRGFVFDLGTCMCQNIKCSGQGSRCGSSEPMRASSEAESRSRGCLALERGGVSLARCRIPWAKQSFAREGLGLTVLVGRWGRGPLLLGCDRLERVLCFVNSFCFVICEIKWVSPRFFRDPYGCPRQRVSSKLKLKPLCNKCSKSAINERQHFHIPKWAIFILLHFIILIK